MGAPHLLSHARSVRLQLVPLHARAPRLGVVAVVRDPPPSPTVLPTARPTVCPLLRDIMHSRALSLSSEAGSCHAQQLSLCRGWQLSCTATFSLQRLTVVVCVNARFSACV